MVPGLTRRVAAAVFAGVLLTPSPFQAQSVTTTSASTRSFTNARLGMTVVGTEFDLPYGQWNVASIAPAGVIDQVFVVAEESSEGGPGQRTAESRVRDNVRIAPTAIQTLYFPIQEYARAHAGIGPDAFAQIDRTKFGFAVAELGKSPWPDDAGKPLSGPFFFLVPGTPIPAAPGPQARVARTPLVLELRPYLDDGKQWVLFSDASVERVPIDRALIAKYHLTLTTVRKAEPAATRGATTNVRRAVMALLKNSTTPTVTLTLADAATSRRMDVRWTLAGGQSDPQLMAEWAAARMGEWRALADRVDAATLHTWIARAPELYGTGAVTTPDFALIAEQDRTWDVFSMLGGRAALRETLQTQLLRPQAAPTRFGAAPVPISTLKGVDVAALPFDRLLAGKPGVRLALADSVPMDRLFIYFAKPSALFPFLDKGGDFLARSGSVFTSSAYDDDLTSRYLRRLGLAETAIRRRRRARPPHARHRRSKSRRHHGQTDGVRAHRVVGTAGRSRLPQHEPQGARSHAAGWRARRGEREPRPQRGVPLHAHGAAAQAG